MSYIHFGCITVQKCNHLTQLKIFFIPVLDRNTRNFVTFF